MYDCPFCVKETGILHEKEITVWKSKKADRL